MSFLRWTLPLSVGIGVVGILPLAAQSVRQGEVGAIPKKVHAFVSPMIIETAFPGPEADLWKATAGTWFTHPEWTALGKYTCDGVALRAGLPRMSGFRDPDDQTPDEERLRPRPAIKLKAQPLKGEEAGGSKLTFEFAAINPKGNQDKIVTVFLELLDAQGSVVQAASLEIKARDNAYQTEPVATHFNVTATQLKALQKMRLTVSTEDF